MIEHRFFAASEISTMMLVAGHHTDGFMLVVRVLQPSFAPMQFAL